MSELQVLTFEGTTNNALYNLTIDILEGKTIILKQARFEISYTTGDIALLPRVVNVGIGSIVSTAYVIDNDPGFNYFKIGLDHSPATIGAVTYNISTTFPDSGFKVSGRIPKNCQVILLDSTHTALTGLVYYFLQFVVVG